ncbi:hypothetical protein FRC03_011395 [Tulasnella sp. 419]|nr:hypothetical protein FRC03_011395 [Tulasnella sp. 419]
MLFQRSFLYALLCNISLAYTKPLGRRQSGLITGHKRGLAWGGGDADITQYEQNDNVGWFYTWNVRNWIQKPHDLEFVPMLWGEKQIADYPNFVNQEKITSGEVKAVLGMNEPEQAGQSNLTPIAAAQMWRTYLEPLKGYNPAVLLGSPALSAATRSKQWLTDFMNACATLGGCTIDFLALHWYGKNGTQFISYMENMYQIFQKDIWVTEFACQEFGINETQCTSDEAVKFMETTQAWLDSAPYIKRYAWFGAMKDPVINHVNAIMDPTGAINNLGLQYIGLRQPGDNLGGQANLSNSTSDAPGGISIASNARQKVVFQVNLHSVTLSLLTLSLITWLSPGW